jgi:hypothetical protein
VDDLVDDLGAPTFAEVGDALDETRHAGDRSVRLQTAILRMSLVATKRVTNR